MRAKIIIVAFVLFLNNITSKTWGIEPIALYEEAKGIVTGKVIENSTKAPLEFVTVVLHLASDSSVVTGTVTDLDGKFTIANLSNGNYYLEINYLGFQKLLVSDIKISQDKLQFELGEVSILPIENVLKEVTVTGEKAKVEYKLDKRIVNVDKNLNAQGGSAISALENTPSVQVDAQGNLTLRGSSDYIVLIDGKPSVVKGSDALKQIPASAIKQIEVMTNPSAKYDADGNTGIINIISKKEKLQGLSGNVGLSGDFKDKYKANAQFNYRKGKVNFFTAFDFADRTNHNTININNITYKPEGNQYVDEFMDEWYCHDNLSLKAGFDYDPNENNSFTFSGNIGRQGYDNGTDAVYKKYDDLGSSVYNSSSNTVDVSGNIINFSADYRHKFADNHSLSLSLYYGLWDGLDGNLLSEWNTDALYNKTRINTQLDYAKDNFNYQYRANIDYSVPLKDGKFEAGLQYRFESRSEDYLFRNYDVATGSWINNAVYSYNQDYENAIYSGYAIYSSKLVGINYQLGVRSEQFLRDIIINTDVEPHEFNKFMVYPSVHFSKEINEKHNFQLSYSRRINRPQPYLLNYTPSYKDPYNIFMGSPNLKCEYIDAFEFNYRVVLKAVTLSTQTYFRNTSNAFTALRLLGDDGIMIHQLVNADNQTAFGVEQNIDIEINKWWKLSTNINVYNTTLKTMLGEEKLSQNVNSWDGRLVSNFNFKKGTRIQATGYYRAKNIDAMGETSGFYTFALAINQSLLNNKLSVGISAQNIFNTIVFDYSTKTADFNNNYRISNEALVVMFNLSYSFNNFQQKNRGRKDDIDFKGGGAF
jgi:outer membrane receptor protein involved in Fe transport